MSFHILSIVFHWLVLTVSANQQQEQARCELSKWDSTTDQPCLLGRACDAVATGIESQTFRK